MSPLNWAPGDCPFVFTDVLVPVIQQRISFGSEELHGPLCSMTNISCVFILNYTAELSLSHSLSLYALFHYYFQRHLLASDNRTVEVWKRSVTPVPTWTCTETASQLLRKTALELHGYLQQLVPRVWHRWKTDNSFLTARLVSNTRALACLFATERRNKNCSTF
jgi:hypothetical protein